MTFYTQIKPFVLTLSEPKTICAITLFDKSGSVMYFQLLESDFNPGWSIVTVQHRSWAKMPGELDNPRYCKIHGFY